MSRVRCEAVSKRFGATTALDAVSLDVADGSLTALLGPSGSGKTTLLRSIAGFVVPDAGRIMFDTESIERVPPQRRQIGMVFQAYALFPHLSVAENVAFGLRIRRVAKAEARERVAEALRLVRLEGYADRRPRQLSGGQQQRVALARALVTRPRVLLLDEPLSALDRRLRQAMQLELRSLQRQVGITTILVTHDQEEALTMADRIAVLAEGRLVQEGTPQEVYERPRTAFAATFLGEANLIDGGARAVRPERVRLVRAGETVPPGQRALPVIVREVVYAGSSITYLCTGQDSEIRVVTANTGEPGPAGGEHAQAAFRIEDAVEMQG